MKTLSLKVLSIISLSILLIANIPAAAQYNTGYDSYNTGYYCYQCPVCGTVFQLTAYEVAYTNPYTLCPACGQAYAGYFIQVPCQATSYSSTNSDIPNGAYQGSYQSGNTMGSWSSEHTTLEPYDSSTETNTQPSNIQSSNTEASRTDNRPNSLANKGKILMIVSPKDYQEKELNAPRDYFRSNGYAVLVASKGVRTATSMSGETTPIDFDLKDIKVSDYSAIVFVGGEGIYNLKLNEDKDYINVAKAAAAQSKLIGAICLGPWILADAGVLNGKRATAAETDYIKSKGAIVSEEPVVRDGNIITGEGPDSSEDFAVAIIDALEGGSAQSLSQEEPIC
ncbi:MAG: DJ-1/PfpI family protein [Methanotrichaceae archaeon]